MQELGFTARHPMLVKIGLAMMSTIACLMFAEATVRFILHWYDLQNVRAWRTLGQVDTQLDATQNIAFRQMIRPSENHRIIYELRPNISVRFYNKPVMINTYGFRGPEYSPLKSGKTFRIVGLGDSVMFGWGVSYDESYLALLSQYLNQSSPAGYSWEIINTAVPGYNTAMEVETFREKGLFYQPDVVIIEYVGNDLALPNFIQTSDNYLSVRKSFLLEKFVLRLKPEGSSMHDGLRDAPLHAEHGLGFEDTPARVPDRYRDMVGIEAYRSSMALLKELSVKYEFLVMVFSHAVIPAPLKDILNELGFPMLEGGRALKEFMTKHGMTDYFKSPLVLSLTDPHPSVLGHSILAGALYTYLQKSGILRQISERRGLSQYHSPSPSGKGQG